MKKYVAIAIFLLLAGFLIFEQLTISNYLDEIIQKTEYLSSIALGREDIQTEEIKNAFFDLEETWVHHEGVISLFANHIDMQDFCIELEKMQGNIDVNQYEDFTASLRVLSHLAEDCKKFLGTDFKNIF